MTMDLATAIIGIGLLVAGLAAARRIVPIPLPKWSTLAVLVIGAAVLGGLASGERAVVTVAMVALLTAGLPSFIVWWWRRGEVRRRETARRRESAATAARHRVPPAPPAGEEP